MASRTFVSEAHSVAAARRFVHDLLERAGADDFPAVLLTSELAANVVEHACTDFDIVVTIDDTVVRVEIHDGVAVTEAFRDLIANPPFAVEATSLRGRGLLFLGSSATRFGLIDNGPDGKAIWFEIDRQPADRTTEGR